jgi:hypothetical protein
MRNAIALGFIFMFSSLFASKASCQTVGTNTPPPEERVYHRFISCFTTLGPIPVSLSSEPTAPYSATEESSLVQTLSDGTHITAKPRTSKTYRDSQGRIRNEQAFCGPSSDDHGAVVVTISDPVAGVGYVLDMQNHIAHRFAGTPKPGTAPSGFQARPLVAQGSVRGAVTATLPDRPSPSISAKARRNSESEPLGTQTIEGLAAEGTRTTEIIPVNYQGNDKEMKTVSETWVSSELKTTILRKTSDPRSGEFTWRLVDINLSEPDSSLFQVPADFKITDDTEPITIKYSD